MSEGTHDVVADNPRDDAITNLILFISGYNGSVTREDAKHISDELRDKHSKITALATENRRLREALADMEECGELAICALKAVHANGALSDAQRAVVDDALEKYFSVMPVWRSFARAALSPAEKGEA